MGDGRILEWTAGFIDTLSATCRLPMYEITKTDCESLAICNHTKIKKCNQQSGQLI